MKQNDYIIRLERKEEQRCVENLVREAFWNVYRPGCMEHYVLHKMRTHPDFIPQLNFVMEVGGEVIGQNVFVRAAIAADDGSTVPVCAMGPICIAPKFQRKGYGKILLDYTLEEAKKLGIPAVCFEGNIDFYGKSGFARASEFSLRYHGFADAPFFLCKELQEGYLDGVSGEYTPPGCYFADEADVEAFDRTFPEKETRKLDSQLFE